MEWHTKFLARCAHSNSPKKLSKKHRVNEAWIFLFILKCRANSTNTFLQRSPHFEPVYVVGTEPGAGWEVIGSHYCVLSPISDTLYTLVYLILKPSLQEGIFVVAILHMRKTRAKGAVGLAQGQQCWSHHSNLLESDPRGHGEHFLFSVPGDFKV